MDIINRRKALTVVAAMPAAAALAAVVPALAGEDEARRITTNIAKLPSLHAHLMTEGGDDDSRRPGFGLHGQLYNYGFR
jgi:hypothetical protein